MKKNLEKSLLLLLILSARFAFGQDVLRDTGNISLPYWINADRVEPRIFMLECKHGNKSISYVVNNIPKPGDEMITISGKQISFITHEFTFKLIGEKTCHSHISSIGDSTFKLVEIISAKPIIKSPHYTIDTSKHFDLIGRWTFVGFKNSVDSIFAYDIDLALDTFKTYKFESFPRNRDSIFGDPYLNKDTFIEFRNRRDTDTSVFNYGFLFSDFCNTFYGKFTSRYEGNMEPRINGSSWRACYTYSPEHRYFNKLYLNAIANVGSYVINHNELTLKDMNSNRLMIFIRDENYIPKNYNAKDKLH